MLSVAVYRCGDVVGDGMKEGYSELISRLRELAEWAEGNIWEVPIDLPDRLTEAANALEYAQNGVDTNLYDTKEVHENVTVEVWRNSYTGKISVGWYENKDERTND